MGRPTTARIEYYRPGLPALSTWVEVQIDGQDGVAPLLGLDRRCISIQLGTHLYRGAEAFGVWDDDEFLYVVADGRGEWGGSYFDSISKATGKKTRAVISCIRARCMLGEVPFVGVSMDNLHARQLGFRKG